MESDDLRAGADDLLAVSDDLQASLVALSRLSTGTMGLEDLLVQVATFCGAGHPHADGAGLTMIEDDRADTIVASAPFVREIDAIQYGIGEGPCISVGKMASTRRRRSASCSRYPQRSSCRTHRSWRTPGGRRRPCKRR